VIGTPVIDTTAGDYLCGEQVRDRVRANIFPEDSRLGFGEWRGEIQRARGHQRVGARNWRRGIWGSVPFSAKTQLQRPGLALVNGVVYVTWASHEDSDPYHGWMIGYNASTLAQVSVFNDTPNGDRGGYG